MKKNIVKITKTKSKIGHVKFSIELTFDSRDPSACQQAFNRVAFILNEVLSTDAEREEFLTPFEAAVKKATAK